MIPHHGTHHFAQVYARFRTRIASSHILSTIAFLTCLPHSKPHLSRAKHASITLTEANAERACMHACNACGNMIRNRVRARECCREHSLKQAMHPDIVGRSSGSTAVPAIAYECRRSLKPLRSVMQSAAAFAADMQSANLLACWGLHIAAVAHPSHPLAFCERFGRCLPFHYDSSLEGSRYRLGHLSRGRCGQPPVRAPCASSSLLRTSTAARK